MATNCHKVFCDIIVEFSFPFDHLCRNGKASFLIAKKTKPARHGRGYFFCLSRLFHKNNNIQQEPFQHLPRKERP